LCVAVLGCGGKEQASTPPTDTPTPDTPPDAAPPADPMTPPADPLTPTPGEPAAPADPAVAAPADQQEDSLLQYATADSALIGMFNADQTLTQPLVKQLLSKLPDVRENLTDEVTYSHAMAVLASKRDTNDADSFGPPGEFGTVIVWSTAGPATEWLAKTMPGDYNIDQPTETYKGAQVYSQEGRRGTFAQKGPIVFLSTSAVFLKSMLDAEGPSKEMAALVAKANTSRDACVAFDLTKIPAIMAELNNVRDPIMAGLAQNFQNVQQGYASAGLEGGNLIDIHLDAKDAESAEQLASLTKALLPIVQGMMAQGLASAPQDVRDVVMPKGTALIKGIDVKNDGASVTAVAARPADLEQWPQELGPVIAMMRKRAKEVERTNMMKQLALAMHNYHDTYGSLPPAVFRDEKGNPLYSWRVGLLPFMEQAQLWDLWDQDAPWDSPQNKELAATDLGAFGGVNTRYLVFVGPGTMFEEIKDAPRRKGLHFRDITDGTSNTIMVVEAGPDKAVPWASPQDLTFDDDPIKALGNLPDGKVIVALGDGSVRTLDVKQLAEKLKLLIQRNDGQAVEF